MIVTDTDIMMKGACYPQVKKFREVFGDEINVSEHNLFQAYIAELSVSWFVEHFLGKDMIGRYLSQRTDWYEGWKLGLMTTTKYYENLSAFVMELVKEYETQSQIPTVS